MEEDFDATWENYNNFGWTDACDLSTPFPIEEFGYPEYYEAYLAGWSDCKESVR